MCVGGMSGRVRRGYASRALMGGAPRTSRTSPFTPTQVVVMSGGLVAEYASPHELLSRQSLFAQLVDEMGPEAAAALRAEAAQAHAARSKAA